MRDYNFFQPYLDRGTRRTAEGSYPFAIIIVGLIVVLAAFPLFNLYQLSGLNKEISELESQVLNSPNYGLLAEVDHQQSVVATTRSRLTTLQQMDATLTGMEWLDDDLLQTLLSVFPRDLAIDGISLSDGGQVSFSGSATNKPAIAELEYNLRNTGRFEDMHIASIARAGTERAEEFRFSLSMRVKGVGTNAGN